MSDPVNQQPNPGQKLNPETQPHPVDHPILAGANTISPNSAPSQVQQVANPVNIQAPVAAPAPAQPLAAHPQTQPAPTPAPAPQPTPSPPVGALPSSNVNPGANKIHVASQTTKRLGLAAIIGVLLIITGVTGYWFYSQNQYHNWLVQFDSKSDDYYSAKSQYLLHSSHVDALSVLGGDGPNIYTQIGTEIIAMQKSQTDVVTQYKAWLSQASSLKSKHLWLSSDQLKFSNKVVTDLEPAQKVIEDSDKAIQPYLTSFATFYAMIADVFKFGQSLRDNYSQISPTYFDYLKKYDTPDPIYNDAENIKKYYPTMSRQLALMQSELGGGYRAVVKISQGNYEGVTDLSKFGSTFDKSQSATDKLKKETEVAIRNPEWDKVYYKLNTDLRNDVNGFEPGKGILGWHRYEAFMVVGAIGQYRLANSEKFPISDNFNGILKTLKPYLADELKAPDAITYKSDGKLTQFSFKEDYSGDEVVVSQSTLPETKKDAAQ